MALNEFDRLLKERLMDAIQRLEISAHTGFAYFLAIKYGQHAHENPELFYNAEYHAKLL